MKKGGLGSEKMWKNDGDMVDYGEKWWKYEGKMMGW